MLVMLDDEKSPEVKEYDFSATFDSFKQLLFIVMSFIPLEISFCI